METHGRIAVEGFPAAVHPGLGWILAEAGGGTAAPLLAAALEAAARGLREREPDTVPAIAATRRAYRALGKDPARYRPSAEALSRRIRKGEPPPLLDPRVDLGTLVSLETGFSIGVYDADRLAPPLVFRPGRPGESYPGIGGIVVNLEGLPVLADRDGPCGSPTRDSARTAVRPETGRILFVLYGFAPHPVDHAALDRARVLLVEHLGAGILGAGLAG